MFSARARPRLGLALFATSLPAAAFAQTPNPLGVEWVGDNSGGNATTSSAPHNPLGIEWVGGDTSAPPPPSATTNPLGVEWVGGTMPASQPTPSTTSGIRMDGTTPTRPSPPPPPPPEPTQSPSLPPEKPAPQPPAPVAPPPNVTLPPPAPGHANLAATLADTWTYQAVAFTGSQGTISETRGVSGTLTFKPNGQYEQALSIGGIANVVKGQYRIVGDRLETTYAWRGESVTDSFALYLDPTGKRLTLAGLGSPQSHYTLQRVE